MHYLQCIYVLSQGNIGHSKLFCQTVTRKFSLKQGSQDWDDKFPQLKFIKPRKLRFITTRGITSLMFRVTASHVLSQKKKQTLFFIAIFFIRW